MYWIVGQGKEKETKEATQRNRLCHFYLSFFCYEVALNPPWSVNRMPFNDDTREKGDLL